MGAAAVAVYPLAFYSAHAPFRRGGWNGGVHRFRPRCGRAHRAVRRRTTASPAGGSSGALLGISGAALLSFAGHGGGAAAGGDGSPWLSTTGILLGLLAGATYALYSWAAHRIIGAGIPSKAAMGAVFGLGGLLLMPVLAVTGGALLESWTAAAVGAYMALVPMFAGYLLFGWGLGRVGASTATGISLLETVVAAVLAVLVVGERLPAAGWLGAAVVLGSLFILGPGRTAEKQAPIPATGLRR